MSNKYGSCKYCYRSLEKTKCPKSTNDVFWLTILFDLWTIIIYVVFLLLSFVNKNIERKERNIKKIITCVNKDCINYLNGCFNGKGLYS